VIAGDYFDLTLLVKADTSTSVRADETWFAIEMVA
jgi:hypothetical protein